MAGLAVYKTNGKLQRRDNALTREVTGALVHLIKSGKTLFPKGGILTICLEGEDGQEKLVNISCSTIHSWVKRGCVVPETGESLRHLLNQARIDYRTKKREETRERLSAESEKHIEEVLGLKSLEPRVTMSGKLVTDAEGNPVMKHNIEILKIKTDVAKFATERLMPEVYGKADKNKQKVAVFDLAELRRAHDEMERQGYFERK